MACLRAVEQSRTARFNVSRRSCFVHVFLCFSGFNGGTSEVCCSAALWPQLAELPTNAAQVWLPEARPFSGRFYHRRSAARWRPCGLPPERIWSLTLRDSGRIAFASCPLVSLNSRLHERAASFFLHYFPPRLGSSRAFCRAEAARILEGLEKSKYQSSRLTQRCRDLSFSRLETQVQLPIGNRLAIHFKLRVVSRRSRPASFTSCGSPLRRHGNSGSSQPKRLSSG